MQTKILHDSIAMKSTMLIHSTLIKMLNNTQSKMMLWNTPGEQSEKFVQQRTDLDDAGLHSK